MAIEKLDKSELYGFPVTDLETATAEETAGGITLPVIVVSNGVLTYKVVATKTWSDYVATTTADAISAANAKVDAAVKDSQAKTAAAVNSANDAATRAGSAAQDAQVAATAYQRAKSEVEQLKTDTAAMEQRVAGVGTTISNAEAATAKAESAAKYADEKAGVADIAAKNADATVSELKQLSTDFVGKTMGVPTEMRLEYLKEISLRNDVPQRIKVSLIPSYYPQNFIFQFVEGDGIRVDPGGNIRLIKEGVTSLWVIPLGNTSLWQEISIRVKQPEMRLVDASSFRIVDGVFRI